jgi:hypothetical protein
MNRIEQFTAPRCSPKKISKGGFFARSGTAGRGDSGIRGSV